MYLPAGAGASKFWKKPTELSHSSRAPAQNKVNTSNVETTTRIPDNIYNGDIESSIEHEQPRDN